ncbi:MAG: M12 family metallopeptidase [Miltoncostaeaceae bacterium]
MGTPADRESSPATPQYCASPQPAPAALPAGLLPARERAIVVGSKKWVNGTVLHYHFFDRSTDGSQVRVAGGGTRFVSWVGSDAQRDRVREAFAAWERTGIGLRLVEVDDRSEAEIRIGFMEGDGSWSYLGRDVLGIADDQRTMNFGWDLRPHHELATALHEVGHTLGMPHEHQNPNAGIVWDEDAVYASLAAPPNRWTRETTYHNILRKLPPGEVEGSDWDPDSIMHYPFAGRLIEAPPPYDTTGVSPPGTLSAADTTWARTWYPPTEGDPPALAPLTAAPLQLAPFEQADFLLVPPATRGYTIQTLGHADTVLTLFEEVAGEPRFVAGDDDGGHDRNAQIEAKLFAGRRYIVRSRLYYASASGGTTVIYW